MATGPEVAVGWGQNQKNCGLMSQAVAQIPQPSVDELRFSSSDGTSLPA